MAQDIQRTETTEPTEAKSHGYTAGPAPGDGASTHGRLRYSSGFTLLQLIAEYRALRASVLKLWQQGGADVSLEHTADMMRFNEAIDQSLANAAVAYSDKLNETRDIFLAILGYDLRSPLAATATVGGYLTRPGTFWVRTAGLTD